MPRTGERAGGQGEICRGVPGAARSTAPGAQEGNTAPCSAAAKLQLTAAAIVGSSLLFLVPPWLL